MGQQQAWWFGLDRKWWVLIAVGVGTFMSALDGSVVNAVVPVIMRGFGISLATTEWIMMIYLVVVSGLLLTFGRLGDMLGHKRVYLAGFSIFIAGSLLCGLSGSAALLIGMRGLQAIGAAMLFSNSPAILTTAFPASQRGQALGLLGMMTYLGLMVGPALGGYLTDQRGWPSIFFINVPIGLAGVLLAYFAIHSVQAPAHGEQFDPFGALSFIAGLSALLLALSQGESWGWLSPTVLGLIAFAIVLLVAFVRIEQVVPHPMFDLDLLRNRTFSATTLSAFLNYVCVYSVAFLLPFYLIQYRNLSPGYAGLLLAAQALIMAIVAPLSGTLSDRTGTRILAGSGMAILTISLLLLGLVDAETNSWGIVARLALVGLGTGLFVSPNNSALMGAAPPARRGTAAATLAAARNVGMVMGVALAGAVFAAALSAHGGAGAGFIPAFRDTFLVVALVAAAGTITCIVASK